MLYSAECIQDISNRCDLDPGLAKLDRPTWRHPIIGQT
jgi:hypothetical protein